MTVPNSDGLEYLISTVPGTQFRHTSAPGFDGANLRLIRAVTDSLLSRPLTDLLAVTYGPFLLSVRSRPLVSIRPASPAEPE